MGTSRIITSAIAATSAMTLFSYISSRPKKRNFKEPQLLAFLVRPYLSDIDHRLVSPAGWILHYGMGAVLAGVLHQSWKQHRKASKLKKGLVSGVLSGLSGILIWKTIFSIHPAPPRIHFNRFYPHLLLAHFVYSLSLVALDDRQK